VHPHPSAPAELKTSFPDFLRKFESSGGKVYKEFWEAPEKLWRPRYRALEDAEINAVLVSTWCVVFRSLIEMAYRAVGLPCDDEYHSTYLI